MTRHSYAKFVSIQTKNIMKDEFVDDISKIYREATDGHTRFACTYNSLDLRRL